MLFTRDIAKQMILRIENGWIETSRQNPPLKKAALPILVSKGRKGQRKRCYLVIRAPLPQVMGTNKGPLRSHYLTPRIKIVPAGIFRCESWWLMKMEQISNTNREVVREWSVSGKAWCGDRGAGCPAAPTLTSASGACRRHSLILKCSFLASGFSPYCQCLSVLWPWLVWHLFWQEGGGFDLVHDPVFVNFHAYPKRYNFLSVECWTCRFYDFQLYYPYTRVHAVYQFRQRHSTLAYLLLALTSLLSSFDPGVLGTLIWVGICPFFLIVQSSFVLYIWRVILSGTQGRISFQNLYPIPSLLEEPLHYWKESNALNFERIFHPQNRK